MKNSDKIAVYLDTQDYSRFGDVLRGIADNSTRELYFRLLKFRESGRVVFPFSMPLLSELLQYTDQTREICLAKAEAIENLCGEWAMPYPSRLVAMEIALAAKKLLNVRLKNEPEFMNNRRYWYPNIDNHLDGFRKKISGEIDKIFAQYPQSTYTQRRKLKKLRRKLDVVKLAKQGSFSETEDQLGIPEKYVRRALIPLLERKISSKEAVHRLFEGIAKPTMFIEVFFERYDGDSSAIPEWMSGMGKKLKASVEQAMEPTEPFRDLSGSDDILRDIMSRESVKYRRAMAKLGYEATEEYLPEPLVAGDEDLSDEILAEIASANLLANVFHRYFEQVLGLRGHRAKFERSLAGDLVHLVYLPHVDLWRGDRRFSAIVSEVAPEYGDSVVSKLKDLPAKIDRTLKLAYP